MRLVTNRQNSSCLLLRIRSKNNLPNSSFKYASQMVLLCYCLNGHTFNQPLNQTNVGHWVNSLFLHRKMFMHFCPIIFVWFLVVDIFPFFFFFFLYTKKHLSNRPKQSIQQYSVKSYVILKSIDFEVSQMTHKCCKSACSLQIRTETVNRTCLKILNS